MIKKYFCTQSKWTEFVEDVKFMQMKFIDMVFDHSFYFYFVKIISIMF